MDIMHTLLTHPIRAPLRLTEAALLLATAMVAVAEAAVVTTKVLGAMEAIIVVLLKSLTPIIRSAPLGHRMAPLSQAVTGKVTHR